MTFKNGFANWRTVVFTAANQYSKLKRSGFNGICSCDLLMMGKKILPLPLVFVASGSCFLLLLFFRLSCFVCVCLPLFIVSKSNWFCTFSLFLRYTIGLKNSRHFFFIQSELKPKPIATRSLAFSRAFRQLHVITSSFALFDQPIDQSFNQSINHSF